MQSKKETIKRVLDLAGIPKPEQQHPLHWAAHHANLPLLETLKECLEPALLTAMSKTTPEKLGNIPLMLFLFNERDEQTDIEDFNKAFDMIFNLTPEESYLPHNPLVEACQTNNCHAIDMLLNKHPQLAITPNKGGETALFCATYMGHTKVIQLLIQVAPKAVNIPSSVDSQGQMEKVAVSTPIEALLTEETLNPENSLTIILQETPPKILFQSDNVKILYQLPFKEKINMYFNTIEALTSSTFRLLPFKRAIQEGWIHVAYSGFMKIFYSGRIHYLAAIDIDNISNKFIASMLHFLTNCLQPEKLNAAIIRKLIDESNCNSREDIQKTFLRLLRKYDLAGLPPFLDVHQPENALKPKATKDKNEISSFLSNVTNAVQSKTCLTITHHSFSPYQAKKIASNKPDRPPKRKLGQNAQIGPIKRVGTIHSPATS